MVNNEIITYIRNSRKSNLTDDAIRSNLKMSGWKDSDIDEAFKVALSNAPIPQMAVTPELKNYRRMKTLKVFLVSILLPILYMSVALSSAILNSPSQFLNLLFNQGQVIFWILGLLIIYGVSFLVTKNDFPANTKLGEFGNILVKGFAVWGIMLGIFFVLCFAAFLLFAGRI